MRFFGFWRKLTIIIDFLYGEYRRQNYFGFFCENRIKKSSFLEFWQIFSCFREAEIRQKWGFPAITRPKMVKFCSNFYQKLFVLFLGHCHILTHFGQICPPPGGSKKSQIFLRFKKLSQVTLVMLQFSPTGESQMWVQWNRIALEETMIWLDFLSRQVSMGK